MCVNVCHAPIIVCPYFCEKNRVVMPVNCHIHVAHLYCCLLCQHQYIQTALKESYTKLIDMQSYFKLRKHKLR